MTFSGPKVAKLLALSSLALFAFALLFRATIYGHMYKAPEDPHGLSDVIEFLLGWALMLLLGISGIVTLALLAKGPRMNRLAGAWLLVVCVGIAMLFEPLHTLAARWAL